MDYVRKDEEVGDEDVEFGWEVHELWNWFWSCFGGEWLYHPAEAFWLGVGDLFHGV